MDELGVGRELRITLDKLDACFLQLGILVGIDTVSADHFAITSQKPSSNVNTNEPPVTCPSASYLRIRAATVE